MGEFLRTVADCAAVQTHKCLEGTSHTSLVFWCAASLQQPDWNAFSQLGTDWGHLGRGLCWLVDTSVGHFLDLVWEGPAAQPTVGRATPG